MTSMRRNDVASTSFRRHVPNRFLINQCQIITFLILKYDIIENSRMELRGIVLPVQVGGLFGGGGAKGYVGPPPLKLLGGAWPPWPPSSYAYATVYPSTYFVHRGYKIRGERKKNFQATFKFVALKFIIFKIYIVLLKLRILSEEATLSFYYYLPIQRGSPLSGKNFFSGSKYFIEGV